ncbi:MarR family transcriptional regulator [archaeon]|nr:MarR family transcriptional regulator [archaeon]
MKTKYLSITLFILSVLIATSFYGLKLKEDEHLKELMTLSQGKCVINGVCLHQERAWGWYVAGWTISAILFLVSLYLYFSEKAQEQLMQYQKSVAESLKEAQKKTTQEDKLKAFLGGFSEDERKVLTSIKEQDGILQSTLRYRTGISKSTLSLMLKNFEEKGLISRKEEGKTNKVFWKKVY